MDAATCNYNGRLLSDANVYQPCSSLVPYCPPGFRVTLEGQCGTSIIGSSFQADCCVPCLADCPPQRVRGASWEQCPGYTAHDTQDQCVAGCDVGYYKSASGGVESCAACTNCEAGLNAV